VTFEIEAGFLSFFFFVSSIGCGWKIETEFGLTRDEFANIQTRRHRTGLRRLVEHNSALGAVPDVDGSNHRRVSSI
jgi:hypothetical protein